jgi:hypothetical protein
MPDNKIFSVEFDDSTASIIVKHISPTPKPDVVVQFCQGYWFKRTPDDTKGRLATNLAHGLMELLGMEEI